MTIESKFDVGSIAKTKYNDGVGALYEVQEVNAQKCYGGVQVFLQCRVFIPNYDNKYKEDKKITSYAMSYRNDDKHNMGWVRLREDELIPASEEEIKLLNTAA